MLHTKTPHKKNRSAHGFTLLEVVVAVVILGLAYVAILQNLSFSARNIARLERIRTKIFENTLEFERQLHEQGDEIKETGEVFLKGDKYVLILVTNEDESLTSIELEKL